MFNTEKFICDSYKEADDKNETVKLLAENNGFNVSDVLSILQKNQLIPGPSGSAKSKSNNLEKKETTTTRKPNVDWTPELETKITNMMKDGMRITEIGKKLGIPTQSIYDHRSKNPKKQECETVKTSVIPTSKTEIKLESEEQKKTEPSKSSPDDLSGLLIIKKGLNVAGIDVKKCIIDFTTKDVSLTGNYDNWDVSVFFSKNEQK